MSGKARILRTDIKALEAWHCLCDVHFSPLPNKSNCTVSLQTIGKIEFQLPFPTTTITVILLNKLVRNLTPNWF
eukprot:2879426-Amphidinium_carterae.1